MASGSKVFSREVAKALNKNENEEKNSEGPQKQSREEWRKQKELEEARKLGNAPAEQDEEGKDINPHIPQYISTVPWYVDKTQRASLKHQRAQPEKQEEFSAINQWYKRGVSEKSIATKFRKGACTNCGAMTHKRKDCLERPRKVGAKFTGTSIAPDEHVQPNLKLDFDGKRDRWNGYNPEQHREVLEEYAKIQVAKQAVKAQKLQEELITGKMTETNDREDAGSEDEDKYADEADMPGTNFDSKRRITVRNLRIREDTAKYLRNLNPNSAYYDPKTRSMRENPYADTGINVSEVDFAGDNFVRYTGDTHDMAQTQMFAWDAEERGVNVHLQADPTRLEMLKKSFAVKKDDFKQSQRDSVLEKYGGIEHLNAPPKELLLAQTEHYVEYNRHGGVVKGQEKAKAKSKYNEDVYINNHSSVWGSFWKNGSWGYDCCHSFIKHSYCTGDAGKEIQQEKMTLPKIARQESKMKQLEAKHSAWTTALGIGEKETKSQEQAPEEEHTEVANNTNPPEVVELNADAVELNADASAESGSEQADEPKSLLQQHRDKLKEEQKEKKRQKRREKKKKKQKKRKKQRKETSSSSSDCDSDEPPEKKQRKKMLIKAEKEKLDKEKKVQEAIRKEKARARKVDTLMGLDERKRPYNSMVEVKEPTEAEMEAYYRKKKNEDDPMAHLM